MSPPSTKGDEIHLKLTGQKQGVIKGESTAKKHDGEIEVYSFAWGVGSAPISSGKGKPTISSVTITKPIDRSTTNLVNASLNNELITSATISWSKSSGAGTPDDFMIITLTNAYIVSVQFSSIHSEAGTGMGHETVVIAFQKINIDYSQQNAMGLLQAAGSMSYNVPGAGGGS